ILTVAVGAPCPATPNLTEAGSSNADIAAFCLPGDERSTYWVLLLTALRLRRSPRMNRPTPKPLRRRFFVALGHAIHVTWPVLSVMIAIQLALGLVTGFVEGWSVEDAVYFTFITGLTIGYGDLVPKQTLTRALAIGIGYFGLFVTGVIAAIAVH